MCCRYTTPEWSHRRDYGTSDPAQKHALGSAARARWERFAALLVASPPVMGSLIKKRRKRMRKKKHKKLLKKTRWQRRQQGK